MQQDFEEKTQSQKFEELQTILSQSSTLKNMLNLIKNITDRHNDYDSQAFRKSDHFKFLTGEINKIQMPDLNQLMHSTKTPHCIVALPIKREKKFTLFFVIVPPGQKFDWHNHPKMTGISKCIHGNLKISAIDYHFLKQTGPRQFVYPKDHIRFQNLKYNEGTNISVIEPHAFNIHKIQALKLSAFFDLLTPDYPDDTCQFLSTVQEN